MSVFETQTLYLVGIFIFIWNLHASNVSQKEKASELPDKCENIVQNAVRQGFSVIFRALPENVLSYSPLIVILQMCKLSISYNATVN